MAQITKRFLSADAVDQSKIRLDNNSYLRARNAADNADVSLLKLNASDKIEFASVPQVGSNPSAANDLVRKAYVDSVLEGLKPKQAVRVATTTNITIATALNSGDSIDGVTLADGDRVLVKNQTAAEDNGIYIVDASPYRAPDFDSLSPIDEINGAYTFVQEGTANAGKGFVQTGIVAVLDTDPIDFVFFNSSSSLVGGDGITISGNDVSVDHDGQGLQFTSNQLALELDGSTLSKSASGLKVADLGIDSAQLASNAVTTAKINNDAVDKDKIAADVAGNGLGQNVDGSLEVKVDDSTIEINTDTLRVKDGGITNAKVASGIDAVKLADGSVSNTEFQYLNGTSSNLQSQLDDKLETDLSNIGASILGVANGGTGSSSLASNNVLLGNGTSALQVVAPGTSGNVLTSNGTTWTSAAPAAGYTDEEAQDAVGSILTDSSTIDFTYDDGTPSITAIVKDNSISTAKLVNDSVDKDKIAADVAGNGLGQNVDGSLEVKVDDSTIEINTDTLRVKDAGISTAKLANDSVDKDKIAADVAGAALGQNVDGSLEVKVDDSTIEINTDTLRVKDAGITNAKVATGIDAAKLADGSVSNTEFQYINSLTSNAQTQINARLQNYDAELLTLDGTDITNQYKDLSYAAYSANSISLCVLGGIEQERGVDFTVSLTGGSGGVTRITFAGDLATGGDAALISGDKLIVKYARL